MPQKRLYSLLVLFSIIAIAFAACAPPAPTATQAPAATTEVTEAPAATQPPAATEPAASGVCPSITVADMQGVPACAWPQQYEVAEFETAANCTMSFTGRSEYDSRLVEF